MIGDGPSIFPACRYVHYLVDEQNPPPPPTTTEAWVVKILTPVLEAVFPANPPSMKLNYALYMPEEPLPQGARVARLLGLQDEGKAWATWKEVVVYRNWGVVHVFNLVSHGRRMYRQQVFSSNRCFALHGMKPTNFSSGRPADPATLESGGQWRTKQQATKSLVIARDNHSLRMRETLVPGRNLRGVLPGVLLEHFEFWQGEDLVLRGTPKASNDDRFRYNVRVTIDGANARIERFVADFKDAPELAGRGDHVRPEEDVGTYRGGGADAADEAATAAAAAAVPAAAPTTHGADNASSAAAAAADNKASDEVVAPTQPAANQRIASHNTSMEAMVRPLVDMGFNGTDAADALVKTGYNYAMAEQFLRQKQELDDALAMIGVVSSGEDNVLMLDAAPGAAAPGLKNTADRPTAAAPALPDVAVVTEADLPTPAPTLARQLSADGGVQGRRAHRSHFSETVRRGEQRFFLHSLMDADPASSVFQLARVLSRIEDLSHVLVWAVVRSAEELAVGAAKTISIVELPRLKLKFQPRQDADGEVRLYSLDHDGFFVSDAHIRALERYTADSVAVSVVRGSQMPDDGDGGGGAVGGAGAPEPSVPFPASLQLLADLLPGIPHSIILENRNGELQLLVPSHEMRRPNVRGRPFSDHLVFDRSSGDWIEIMGNNPTFVYPIHTSKLFLRCTTLDSALYLILLRLFSRQYVKSPPC